MSASEIADELEIAHAAASYHARKLAKAGLLDIVDSVGRLTGPGRPPVRYRFVVGLDNRLDRSEGVVALWEATSRDIERRLRLRTRHHVGADAEVWMRPRDFETVCRLAQQISNLIHERAQQRHATGAVHGSVSVFAFELPDTH